MDEYPETFNFDNMTGCTVHNVWYKGYVWVHDVERRYYRIREQLLYKILKYQIRELKVVKKYGMYYLEEF